MNARFSHSAFANLFPSPIPLLAALWSVAVPVTVQGAVPRTHVSIADGRWHINGELTYRGARTEGLLLNVRMVNATFEDLRRPDFDPDANSDEFIAQISDYVANGVRAFTLNLQGGMPGYEGAVNSAFNADGSLRDSYMTRVRRVIEACDRHGAIVILGCYYQRQDQVLKDEDAVRAGVVNVVEWIKASAFSNVVLEIANEFGHGGFDHRFLKSADGQVELIQLARRTAPELLVSTSGLGDGASYENVARASDFLLVHFNSTRLEDIPKRIASLKRYGKPIICNEDQKVGEQGAKAAELCVANGASWGLMLEKLNQHFPFSFRGAADDPLVYTALKRLALAQRTSAGRAESGAPRTAKVDFFVSPRGNDNWSGTLAEPGEGDGPFATMTRARDAVRSLLTAQKRGIRVVVRGGTYYLNSPLEFGPEDSGTEKAPVVYAAAAEERVVLSEGRHLEGGHWSEVNGHKAWVVDIPQVKEGYFRQLFVNGVRRPRTRLPKTGEYSIESLPGYTGDFLRSPTKQFVYGAGDIVPAWRNLRDAEIVAVTKWLDNRMPIESVDAQTRTVTLDRSSLFTLLSGSQPGPYWIENVFEALDTPGQWYLDRPSGQLYYLPQPGEDLASSELVAPRLTQVVRVVGRPGSVAHDLRFEGLIFAHTEWQPPPDYASSLQAGIEVPGALLFDYAERCAVTAGGIEHTGNYGIEVGVGCADIEISHNRITDIGAGGIRIGHFFSWETDGSGRLTERGLQRKAAMPQGPHSRRITVADNEISHCGRFTPEAVGVFVGDNAENKIIHNHIYDLFYSGISVGSVQDFGTNHAQGNIVEFNHIHDIGQGMLSDMAGIYTCSTPGTRIRYNRVHDVSRRDYGGWGIYTDEGAHNIQIERNLVYRCQDGALFAHHNRNIAAQNNIFVFNRISQVDRGGIGGFELACRRNLICYEEGKAIGGYGIGKCGRDVCAFDGNLYWNASGKPILFGTKNLSEWQALGQDKNSLVADPLFVDPSQGNFTLRPSSPARKIGFEPWDLSAIGPRPVSTR